MSGGHDSRNPLARPFSGRLFELVCVLLLSLVLFLPAAASHGTAEAERRERQPDIAIPELSAEARYTIGLIRRGGPFPYERDGVVFGNLERRLPAQERGYYREYTVSTPGVKHRGARRIVAGRGGELFYSDDHYRTFRRIRE